MYLQAARLLRYKATQKRYGRHQIRLVHRHVRARFARRECDPQGAFFMNEDVARHDWVVLHWWATNAVDAGAQRRRRLRRCAVSSWSTLPSL